MKLHEQFPAISNALDGVRSRLGDTACLAHRDALRSSDAPVDPDRRFRWDLWWAVPADVRYPIMDDVYNVGNDTHLDTVLRRWVDAQGWIGTR